MIDHESTDLEGAAYLAAQDAAVDEGDGYAPDPEDYRMPCGCFEYHTADCPLLTYRGGDAPEPYEYDEPDEPYPGAWV